ncbi:NAD-dependent succinate-semialdehyde dehydrogenase [uncultured Maritimibacter sp.]|jgi:succinate-semialdehyde dehydrogenase/glutarate-semialdehyde dehydrogenase|uniref:NAD-dependent succinate-semialdehyde dehydrogenase n=1 Tax=uncultured Maritimibacter sp. TaxID=991866 RepID=UPI000AF77B1A|nr:NAD-dependent succinate-semialdehyde dehydrogenase [uncultured Maritimibacter sp.]
MTTLALRDPSLLETRALIDGDWIASDDSYPITNPATGAQIAHVASMTLAQAETAIESAHRAQPLWAAMTGKERAAILRRLYDLMVENADDLALILTAEMGKPLAEAKGEVLYGASYVEWFAEEAKRIYGDVIPGHTRDTRIVVLKQPVGVVGAITPWNFPSAMLARKLAPALAAGCTMVARPSELTPLSALAIGVLAQRAGLPKGVLNIVPNRRASEFGRLLCSHPKVAKITFTGSTRVGAILMEQGAKTIKKFSLELGGNAPFIVFDDADPEAAAEGALIAKFRNNGQTCVCANRLYVQAGIHDDFVAALARRMRSLVVGDGTGYGVTTGPLINDAAMTKIEAHISDAVSKGATLHLGGARHDLGGTFFQPTLMTGVTQDMQVARDETFGPLAAVVKFDTDADAVAMANDTEFGLAGYFYTNDLSRVWRVAEALECGIVGVNTGLISTEVAPFGGVKQSGQGREGSKYGIEDYLEIKNVVMGGVRGA